MDVSIETCHGKQKSTFLRLHTPSQMCCWMVINVYNALISDKLIKWNSFCLGFSQAPKDWGQYKRYQVSLFLNQRANPPNQDLLKGYETILHTLNFLTPLVSTNGEFREEWEYYGKNFWSFIKFHLFMNIKWSSRGLLWRVGMYPPEFWPGMESKEKGGCPGSKLHCHTSSTGAHEFPIGKSFHRKGEGCPNITLKGTPEVFQQSKITYLNRKKKQKKKTE